MRYIDHQNFIKKVKMNDIIAVRRYLKHSYHSGYICNSVVSESILNDNEKIFNLLINKPDILSNLSTEVIGYTISSNMEGKGLKLKEKVDPIYYFMKILKKINMNSLISNHPDIEIANLQVDLFNEYLRYKRKEKLIKIRKKINT